ncbi:Rho termination factor N-terminal domain-containing protein [Phytohabitans aurantiacus]|uniref:Rho termination factor-like N-terminal domain-containing protein n=1 Tax=Phytohabitans aurantiacus TaxID=3016789 RepID=A0ABQ5R551_9ACTN|nr:Rho termination factor N-terminal domain-containing protein [Phytohabitans aurantiacus]GLI01830.1 hypothetical protein Pa4123_71070 [Phytohabitans aurantiacus]
MMADGSLDALFERVSAGDGDRVALLEQINHRLTARAHAQEASHLLRKARNLTVSPHFDEAFEAFVAAVRQHESTAAGPDEDLEQATKTELYEMAKEAEIPGRSTMTKDELTEALRDSE